MDQSCVTKNSLRDGIVLWEPQEQKCQQRVCQHTVVVQPGQVGWMVNILQWKIVKFKGRSALVFARPVPIFVRVKGQFLWKTVDYITYMNFLRQKIVQSASAGQTKSEAKNLTK